MLILKAMPYFCMGGGMEVMGGGALTPKQSLVGSEIGRVNLEWVNATPQNNC